MSAQNILESRPDETPEARKSKVRRWWEAFCRWCGRWVRFLGLADEDGNLNPLAEMLWSYVSMCGLCLSAGGVLFLPFTGLALGNLAMYGYWLLPALIQGARHNFNLDGIRDQFERLVMPVRPLRRHVVLSTVN